MTDMSSVDSEPNPPMTPYQLVGPMPPPPATELAAARSNGSPGGLTITASALLGFAAVASALFAFAQYNRVTAIRAFLSGKAGLDDLGRADNLATGAVRLLAAAFLVTGIVFIIWQYQFTRKAERLHGPLGLGAGWAICGWLIPVANLILPFIQLSHATKASDPALPPGAPWVGGRTPGLFKAWAATYITAPLIFVVYSTNVARGRASSVETRAMQAIHAGLGAWFAMLIYTAAAILGLFMVWVLDQRQRQAIAAATEPDRAAASPSTA